MKSDILKELDRSSKIYLVSHINPDGDSIGSLLAFGKSLKHKYGEKVILLKSDKIPDTFKFLNNMNYLSDLQILKAIDDNSTLITLDCGDLNRIGAVNDSIKNFKSIINIDHHKSNNLFGEINIVDSDASSTSEIIFKLLKDNSLLIDKDIAEALYTGISSDTGSFKYESTDANTHRIASELLEYNIDKSKIIFYLYQNRSIETTNIFIEAIKKIEFHYHNKIGITIITKNMMKEANASVSDIDGIVEFIRDTENIEIACVIKEIDINKYKVSLRSKSYLDVSQIATHFNGGGHKKAAGMVVEGNVEKIKYKLLQLINKKLR